MDEEHRPVEEGDCGPQREAAARNAIPGEDVAAAERLELSLSRRGGADRLPVLVQGSRGGGAHAGPAGETQSKGEVDVLPVGEERIVEAADLSEGVGPVGSRSTARADRSVRSGELLHRPVPEGVPRPECSVELDPGRVDEVRAVVLQQHSRHHVHARIGERSEQRLEKRRWTEHVVVQEDDHVRRHLLDAAVHGPAEPEIRPERHDTNAREPLAQPVCGPVARCVVDDHGVVLDGLSLEVLERLGEEGARVQRRDDDGCAHVSRAP